jgi:fatty acid desaturase
MDALQQAMAVATADGKLRIAELPEDTRETLKKLHARKPLYAIALAVFPLMWIVIAAAIETASLWWMSLVGTFLIAYCFRCMGVLMHDAVHGSIFRNPTLDRMAAFAMGAPALISGAAYRVNHLNHHRYLRTPRDPDDLSQACRSDEQWRKLFYFRHIAGFHLYIWALPKRASKNASPLEAARITAEYRTILFVVGAIFVGLAFAGHAVWMVWYWLIPLQLTLIAENIRALAEHHGTAGGSELRNTRTMTPGKATSLLLGNLNYHLEHHFVPAIPWYNLHDAHLLLKEHMITGGADMQPSYLKFTVTNFLQGPGKLADHKLSGHGPP